MAEVGEKVHTRITRMEMKGFKSFATKTEIPFQNQFNCILGPNGSGKSNVLDSLCFVLGKAGSKGLRAEKTANLIYNGGKSKKPAKQGEVHIYFDNVSKVFPIEGDEVKISRIVKPTGQSAYKINDTTSTRTQIVDLLSHARINPDGYNIILQGDIVRLVEMSTNDRRTIIEEISGISIYEGKKGKASRELDRVEEQLKEADIVLAERKTYLQELKKERDQAQKFKDLNEKIRRNKATIITRKMTSRNNDLERIQKKVDEEEVKIEAQNKTIAELKEQVIERKRAVDELSREVEAKGEKEQVALMREVETLRVDLALKEQRSSQLVQELERIADRRKELEKSKQSAETKISDINKQVDVAQKRLDSRQKDRERIDAKMEAFQKKNDIASASEIDSRVHEIDSEAEKIQEQITSLREQQQNYVREKDKIDYQVQTIDAKVAKVLEAQKANKGQIQQLQSYQKQLTQTKSRLSISLDRSSSLVPELQTAKGKLATREEALAKLTSRQASIQERVAGSRAVSEILKLRSKNKKIYGTVAELGSVGEEYSMALEIAAGSRLRSIVVEDVQTAQQCIQYLKQNALGVATLLPLDKLSSRPIPSEIRSMSGSGVHGAAIGLVTYDRKFEKAFQHVLGPTVVVDNVTAARRVGVGKVRMVTLDGDLVETSGAMTGGHRTRSKGSGMGFQEKELTGKISNLEGEISDLQSIIARLSQEQSDLSTEIDSLRNERHELEENVLALERELHIDSGDLDASKGNKQSLISESRELDGKIDSVVGEVSTLNKTFAKLKMERAALREKIMKLRSPQALAELNTFQQQKEQLAGETAKISAEREGFINQIKNIYEPEIRNIKQILEQQAKELASFDKEQQENKASTAEMKNSLKDKEKQEQAFRKQFKELFDKRSKLESEKDRLEDKIIASEEKIRGAENTRNGHRIQVATCKAELAGLAQEFKEFEGVEPFKTKEDDVIRVEIRDFERMVNQLGAVNMRALEIYEQVELEYNSLVEKKTLLASERQDVLILINEIDAKKRELFMRTYESIEQHFKEIFSRLSSKGEAFLELEEPEDPFAGGLEIRVRLSGNKFMDIRSLSGGEKTMTALAFLFAIQEYEPASFYILDEVDAALDKKNSERLGDLVRSYSDKAQYIIISHNDTIISQADTLFGVSMNEHGQSQITSLQI